MKTSSRTIERTKKTTTMTTYLTWTQMYQRAYDSEDMDLGSEGRNAARALREFDFKGEQHPQTRQLAYSPLERAFFATGDEASRINSKLWNFTGNKSSKTYPLTPITLGAMSGLATMITLLYITQ